MRLFLISVSCCGKCGVNLKQGLVEYKKLNVESSYFSNQNNSRDKMHLRHHLFCINISRIESC